MLTVVRQHPSYDSYYGLGRMVALYTRKDLDWCVRAVATHTITATIGRTALVATYWHPDDANADAETFEAADALRSHNLVVTGDFNDRHRLWETSRRRAKPRARRLAVWVTEHGLSLLIRNKPTQRRGGVIDNFFALAWMGTADVRQDLGFRLDHFPIVATIYGKAGKTSVPSRLVVPLRRYEDWVDLIWVSLRCVYGALDYIDTTIDADRVALLTLEAFRLVTEALGNKYRNPKAWA